MKRVVLMLVAVFIGQAMMAQMENKKVKVYQKDGVVRTFDRSKVDSVVLKRGENGFDQVVYSSGKEYKSALSNVYSVNFVFPQSDKEEVVAEAVDLGLNSGLLWASHNVGAISPEDPGGYYAWGETEEKEIYNWSNYILGNGTEESVYDFDDFSGTDYDVAHVKWGDGWRMPTMIELSELYWQSHKTDTIINGVKCLKLSRYGNKYIILPLAGMKNGDVLDKYGEYGFYWTTSHGPVSSYWESGWNNLYYPWAYGFYARISSYQPFYYQDYYRYLGLCVRPVKDREKEGISLTEGDFVDLGLSVKWASHNMGASLPEEKGDYYAWGLTEPGQTFNNYTYPYFNEDWYQKGLPQYSSIGENICGTEYDAARVKLGGTCRLPSKDEVEELISQCTYRWIYYNGTYGALFTGPNGNTIFMPTTGYNWAWAGFNDHNYVYCWTGTQHETNVSAAYWLKITDGVLEVVIGGRGNGVVIRPVQE